MITCDNNGLLNRNHRQWFLFGGVCQRRFDFGNTMVCTFDIASGFGYNHFRLGMWHLSYFGNKSNHCAVKLAFLAAEFFILEEKPLALRLTNGAPLPMFRATAVAQTDDFFGKVEFLPLDVR